MTTFSILQRFKKSYVQFIDELLEQFPNEPDLVLVRIFFQDQVLVTDVADSFITHVLPHKKAIQNRDERFFLEHNNIFGMFDSSKVLHFKKLWTSDRLDSDDREAIWKWFDLLCALSELYKNSK